MVAGRHWAQALGVVAAGHAPCVLACVRASQPVCVRPGLPISLLILLLVPALVAPNAVLPACLHACTRAWQARNPPSHGGRAQTCRQVSCTTNIPFACLPASSQAHAYLLDRASSSHHAPLRSIVGCLTQRWAAEKEQRGCRGDHNPAQVAIHPTTGTLVRGTLRTHACTHARTHARTHPTTHAHSSQAVYYIFFTRPNPFLGALDFYVLRPLADNTANRWKSTDFSLREKLGGGNFGAAFEGIKLNVSGPGASACLWCEALCGCVCAHVWCGRRGCSVGSSCCNGCRPQLPGPARTHVCTQAHADTDAHAHVFTRWPAEEREEREHAGGTHSGPEEAARRAEAREPGWGSPEVRACVWAPRRHRQDRVQHMIGRDEVG